MSLRAQMLEIRHSDILSCECTRVRRLDIKSFGEGLVRGEIETITRSLADSAVRKGCGGALAVRGAFGWNVMACPALGADRLADQYAVLTRLSLVFPTVMRRKLQCQLSIRSASGVFGSLR